VDKPVDNFVEDSVFALSEAGIQVAAQFLDAGRGRDLTGFNLLKNMNCDGFASRK
jgi:hypothetical protein